MSDKTEEKLERLIQLIESVMVAKKEDWAMHQEQHKWIEKQMKAAESREEFWSSVANKVISGGIWAGIVGLSTVLGYALKTYLHNP